VKVGLLIYGSLAAASGGYLYDRQLVETLEQCGDTVEIISLPYRRYPQHLGDAFNTRLRRRLNLAQLDVLLEDELNHPSLFLQNRWFTGNFPIVSIVHHLRTDEDHFAGLRQVYRLVERQYLRSVDGFIYNSLATRSSVEALAGFPAPGVVAYPGRADALGTMSEPELIERAFSPGPLRVLFVGNIIPRKNLHILLQGLASVPPGLCCLDIAGDPGVDRRYAARMARLVKNLHMEDRVRFLGKVKPGELLQAYSTHHVLAMPSAHEGFGIAYLEGFEYGMPAIASNHGGAVELVEPRKTGCLVQPGNAGEVAEAIHELAVDRQLLAEMSLHAFKRSREFPTWDETGRKVREYLQKITHP
jgi:glycosyltransferase involved in cell wall biosynthesis